MPKVKANQDEQGRYKTAGLNEAQFMLTFNRIAQKQRENRRNAKRTLKPGALSRKSTQDLARLGQKADGTPFTFEDLARFEKMRKLYRKRRGNEQGITYRELVARSREIDVKRANNRSDDGRGITQASLIGLQKGNIALVRVKASSLSEHEEHLVKIRFDDWEKDMSEASGDDRSYQKATKHTCAGHMSFNCDCGRYQYWYRYVATLGNFQLAPPREMAFPKIRNPNLTGVACKHILRAATMLQSVSWQRILANQMAYQANANGYSDDHQRNHYLNQEEKTAAAKNRKTEANQDKARTEFARYQQRQQQFAKKLRENPQRNAEIRAKLSEERKARLALRRENAKLQQEMEKMRQQLARNANDALKLQLQNFIDGAKLAGVPEGSAMAAFANTNKLPLSMVKKLRGNNS